MDDIHLNIMPEIRHKFIVFYGIKYARYIPNRQIHNVKNFIQKK